jgi:hypothetical protein
VNLKIAGSALFAISLSTFPLEAQYFGDQQIGLVGLKAGTQPAPGYYITLPLYFLDRDISIYGPQGNQILRGVTADINVIVLPGLEVITPYKIFGATYGAAYTQWISNGRVDVAAANFQRSTGYHFGDIYAQPLMLGWHTAHADVTTGYAFFAPSGHGAAGLHMWVHEIYLGTTLYPDAAKKWNFATMMNYDLNQRKTNADITVGNFLTLSGGAGRTFMKGLANAGVSYGAQWKMTHDTGSDIPPVLIINNGRVFSVGPEIDLPLFVKGQNLGFLSFRYQWMVGPKTALGGQTLTASFTFAHLKQQ